MLRKLEIVRYNSQWKNEFVAESRQVLSALGKTAIAIHHIGSTAIPEIYAKPIIDLLVEAEEIAQIDDQTSAMIALGYEAMGEYGIVGRRYFRKDSEAGIRTHHVHIFAVNSPEIERHLVFRDYLRTHPESAREYSNLKRELVKQLDSFDIEGYMDGKDGLIKEIQKRAISWRQGMS